MAFSKRNKNWAKLLAAFYFIAAATPLLFALAVFINGLSQDKLVSQPTEPQLLTKIVLTKAEFERLPRPKKHEILFQDHFYDLVSVYDNNSIVVIYAIKDGKETKLARANARLWQLKNKQNDNI